MTAPFTDGCAYGAIRYQSTAEPVVMLKCYCRNCQPILSVMVGRFLK